MAENEGVGETGEAIVMCTSPDVCLTSGAPVPYQIIARFDSVIRQEATVRFKGNKVMTMDSRITNVIGDEAGTGGGIISGVNLGYCRPITHSTTVRAGGNHVIYHSALYWMNCAGPEGPGNTIGTVLYVESVDCVYVGPLGEVVGDTNPPVVPEKKELSALGQVGGFFQGFWDAGVETVKGIGGMAVGAWKLTGGWIFDSKASMETWSHLTITASVVWNHPEAVWDAIKEPYAEAWSRGEYGKAFGRGAFEVVALVASTKGADKLSKAAKLKKAGEVADVAGKAGKVEEALVDVAKVESKVARGQVSKDGVAVMLAGGATREALPRFTSVESMLEHFSRHAPQFMRLENKSIYGLLDYLGGASRVIKNGAKVTFERGPHAGSINFVSFAGNGKSGAVLEVVATTLEGRVITYTLKQAGQLDKWGMVIIP